MLVPELKRTPFYDAHVKIGARMVDFAGWEMPLLYRGIIEEHNHTRTAASLFDVSHMGRLKISGSGALAFLQKVCTRNLDKCSVGQCVYSLLCNEAGGVRDDIIVSRYDKHFLVVCNASNREKVLAWFNQHADGGVKIEDETFTTAMVAVQGPKAMNLLDSVLPEPVSDTPRYHFTQQRYMMFIQFSVFRTGYTGEDGAEIICGVKAASMAMGYLMKGEPQEHDVLKPAGLGARDTLRMEAGMPLYGHELSEQGDPLAAGLGWAVDLTKEFIGAEALRKVQASGPAQKLVGLFLDSPRCARQGMSVLDAAGKSVGVVTSATMSPTLRRSIAMAYVSADLAAPGTALAVDLRGTAVPASVTPLPFYKRPKKTIQDGD